jgi:hypothetical protein
MGKAFDPAARPDALFGRFEMAIDEDAEPVDWDSVVAKFLLAVTVREPSASALAPPEHKPAAIPVVELSEDSGLNLLSDSCIVGPT